MPQIIPEVNDRVELVLAPAAQSLGLLKTIRMAGKITDHNGNVIAISFEAEPYQISFSVPVEDFYWDHVGKTWRRKTDLIIADCGCVEGRVMTDWWTAP